MLGNIVWPAYLQGHQDSVSGSGTQLLEAIKVQPFAAKSGQSHQDPNFISEFFLMSAQHQLKKKRSKFLRPLKINMPQSNNRKQVRLSAPGLS